MGETPLKFKLKLVIYNSGKIDGTIVSRMLILLFVVRYSLFAIRYFPVPLGSDGGGSLVK